MGTEAGVTLVAARHTQLMPLSPDCHCMYEDVYEHREISLAFLAALLLDPACIDGPRRLG